MTISELQKLPHTAIIRVKDYAKLFKVSYVHAQRLHKKDRQKLNLNRITLFHYLSLYIPELLTTK